MSLKSTSRLQRVLLRGIPIVLLVCVVVIILFSLSIELGVKTTCEMATRKYPGDKVEALIMFVESTEKGYNTHRYSANNHAFWALGQLGDKRALPSLRKLLTGEPYSVPVGPDRGRLRERVPLLQINR